MQELAWIHDGISPLEETAVEELLYLNADSPGNIAAALALPWLADGVSEAEVEALAQLSDIDYFEPPSVHAILGMPFLASVEADDILALRGMSFWGHHGILQFFMAHPAMQAGLTDAQTVVVAAEAYVEEVRHIGRLWVPDAAGIETSTAGTALTPGLKVTVVRTETKDDPWPQTAAIVQEATEFVEGVMGLALPIHHIILVLDDDAVFGKAAGTNHNSLLIGYRPEQEEDARDGDAINFQRGLVHEVAHYYWSGNQGWVDESLANMVQHMYAVEAEALPWALENLREECEVADLEALSALNPDPGDPRYECSYYLGQWLFQELLDGMTEQEVAARLQAFYALSLEGQEADETPGIEIVRQVFDDRLDIVEKHWSGDLNAPENRPFDEGVRRQSLALVRWNDYPAYEGGGVSFRGTLLGNAVLQQTKREAQEGGFQPYTLTVADGHDFVGHILPNLEAGREWILDDDTGSAVATEYFFYPSTNQFKIRFPFPKALSDPTEYVLLVWGYEDASQKQPDGEDANILGYARIRGE